VPKPFLDTREVAQYLGINEKQVYTLIHGRGLPGTKITGKWLFPRHLVDRWIESHVSNLPADTSLLDHAGGLLLVAGSDDPLLDNLVSLFRKRFPETVPLRSRAGSTEGLIALKKGLCHIASVHIFDPINSGHSTKYLRDIVGDDIVVVAFALRKQGLVLPPGNPLEISSLMDVTRKGLRLAIRETGTGTRLLLDRELDRLDLDPDSLVAGSFPADSHLDLDPDSLVAGSFPADSHLDAAMSVMRGDADTALAIEAVSGMLDLDFIPLHEERFDLVIRKQNFFHETVQAFLGLLLDDEFHNLSRTLTGYNVKGAGKVLLT
jgi:excisionase family DNA binding protein